MSHFTAHMLCITGFTRVAVVATFIGPLLPHVMFTFFYV